MITETFDNLSPAIINPIVKDDAIEVDACIITFSHEIEKRVAERYASGEITSLWCATGRTPVYLIEKNGMRRSSGHVLVPRIGTVCFLHQR